MRVPAITYLPKVRVNVNPLSTLGKPTRDFDRLIPILGGVADENGILRHRLAGSARFVVNVLP